MDIELMKDEHGSCYGYFTTGHVDKKAFAELATELEREEYGEPESPAGYDSENVICIYLGELPYTILEI